MNIVISRREDLRERNYILHPNPRNRYWVNLSAGRLQEYAVKCGDAFNVVIVGDATIEGDFYAIPYPVLRPALVEQYRTTDRTGRLRWVAWIRDHQLRVGRYPLPIDVGAFYGNAPELTDPGASSVMSLADQNDYAIENRIIEIAQRRKQSVFRRRVMENFGGQCCVCGLEESELLNASHIVPWAKRVDTRLDPGNGLLLCCLHDSLFDTGYISFDDLLRIVITPTEGKLSPQLRTILRGLDGMQARPSVKWPIKPEYLAYHRANVLRRGSIVSLQLPTVAKPQ